MSLQNAGSWFPAHVGCFARAVPLLTTEVLPLDSLTVWFQVEFLEQANKSCQQVMPVFSSPCTFLVDLTNAQPAVCMWPRIAKNAAQHQIINYPKHQGKILLLCVCVWGGLSLFNLDCVVSGMNFGDRNTVLQCQKVEHPQEGWYVWTIWIAPSWGTSEISHLFKLSCNQTFSPEMISSLILPQYIPF